MSDPVVPTEFNPAESHARQLDAEDPLRMLRDRLSIPGDVYLCGHSLGAQPLAARALIEQELAAWAEQGVDGHFKRSRPWYRYHEQVAGPLGRLVGARPHEVVAMNSLTVNLHLMMVSFYRPTPARHRILIEPSAFPSDLYAVQTQLQWHGFDPAEGLIVPAPREGETTLRSEDLEALLAERGEEIALVLLSGVNYYTGQAFDIPRISAAAHARGCVVGFDLAHAAGNLPLALHDDEVDFAVWCSYKYLNSGPGAVAGCFVHERHARDRDLVRFGGWWGNDPDTRFRMHLEDRFVPVDAADGWQLSNPPILALAPLIASLELFDEAGMTALREKSVALTGYLERWIGHAGGGRVGILTPDDPQARGCQLSLRLASGGRKLFERLSSAGVLVDFREPDVIRLAPVPLYNSFHDVWRVGRALADWAGSP